MGGYLSVQQAWRERPELAARWADKALAHVRSRPPKIKKPKPARNRRGCGPAEDRLWAADRDVAVAGQPGGAEVFPARCLGLEGGVALGDARLVDGKYGGRVLGSHRLDVHDGMLLIAAAALLASCAPRRGAFLGRTGGHARECGQ